MNTPPFNDIIENNLCYDINPNQDTTYFEDESLRDNPNALAIVIERLKNVLEKQGIIRPFSIQPKNNATKE